MILARILPVFAAVLTLSCAAHRPSGIELATSTGNRMLYAVAGTKTGTELAPAQKPYYYLLESEFRISASEAGTLTILVRAGSQGAIDVSIAPLYSFDLVDEWTLRSELESRPFATLQGLSALTHLGIAADPPPGATVAGLAVISSGTSPVIVDGVLHQSRRTGWTSIPGERYYFDAAGGTVSAGAAAAGNLDALPAVSPVFGSRLQIGVPAGTAASEAEQGRLVLSGGGRRFFWRLASDAYTAEMPLFFLPNDDPVRFDSTSPVPTALLLIDEDWNHRFAISADPQLMINWPQDRWRNSRYELFAWDRFPSILIMDTRDYAVQSSFFKRLAFFVEKAGYTGTLQPDSVIGPLHGFNAHDYRAESLADFFNAVARTDFPINTDEQLLRDILEMHGIISMRDGVWVPGEGAILSISRQSSLSLRYLFMAHEAYHGLFFIDSDFRSFTAGVYAAQDSRSREFLESYFAIIDTLAYDTNDTYLMHNEFMAYLLQQGQGRVAPYFTDVLVPRFVRYKGNPSLAEWVRSTGAADFDASARRLNDYVFRRWGLSGGRVWMSGFLQ